MSVLLFRKGSGKVLGVISRRQLETLRQLLPENGRQSMEFYIDESIVDYFEGNGVDDEVVATLRKALGGSFQGGGYRERPTRTATSFGEGTEIILVEV
jgi:hypothetical protein